MMMKVWRPVTFEKQKDVFIGLGLFFLYFILLLSYLKQPFFCDEADNFLGGMVVASGGDVYNEFISQHMPIMYYICAVFRILGANSIIDYRLFSYGLFAGIWVIMYYRYAPKFGKTVMGLFPIGYIIAMAWYLPLSNSILSDQTQAMGLMILFLEFLIFVDYRKISFSNSFWIAFGIFISFGTAFVSIFGIFGIMVAVLGIELRQRRRKKVGILKWSKIIFFKYRYVIILSLLPFAILVIWYIITGNFRNFVLGAYRINTEVYSKYLGGFGESPIVTFFDVIKNYFVYFNTGIMQIHSDPVKGLIILINISINVIFVLKHLKKDLLIGSLMIPVILLSSPRGFDGFHSMPYYMLTIFMGSQLLFEVWNSNKLRENSKVRTVSLIMLMVLILPYGTNFTNIYISIETLIKREIPPNTYAEIADKLLMPDERIYTMGLDFNKYIELDRLPVVSAASTTPWTYEVYGRDELEGLKEYEPKMIFYYPEQETWGYKYKEYAGEIVDFIEGNYTPLSQEYEEIYIKNDFIEEARKRLEIPINDEESNPLEEIEE